MEKSNQTKYTKLILSINKAQDKIDNLKLHSKDYMTQYYNKLINRYYGQLLKANLKLNKYRYEQAISNIK